MTCPTCGNMGIAQDPDGTISACHCEHGAVVRTMSNRDTLMAFAAREHTDQHDERNDAIWTAVPTGLPKAFDAVAAKLRGKYSDSLPSTDEFVASKHAPCLHRCRTCGTELPAGFACGSRCDRCLEEAPSIAPHYDPADDWMMWLLVGMVLGVLIIGALMVFG